MRNIHRHLAALVLATGLVLVAAAPAQAHDELLSSDPAADATVAESPAEITLTFSGELLADMQSAIVEVIAPDGRNIASDAPMVSGAAITQTLAPNSSEGVFAVRWKVVSSDGHPISDEYAYTVTPAMSDVSSPSPTISAAAQSPQPSPSATPLDRSDGDARGTSGGGEFLPIAAVLSGVVVVGATLIVVLMVGRERRRRDRAAVRDEADPAVDGEPADES